MALAGNRENYFLHKLHSLTGIIPVGYYMVQHLVLNTFSLGGPRAFDSVIGFFEAIPWYLLILLEVVAIWVPLLFHSIYGLFITARAKQNFIGTRYGWSQNRMYTYQRWTGIFLFFALLVHVGSTTVVKYVTKDPETIKFEAWHHKLTSFGGLWLIFYLLLVLTASYHLGYGIWNFCIRWGITVAEGAQIRLQKFAFGFFVVMTLIGWGALAGFLLHKPVAKPAETSEARIEKSLGFRA